MVVEAAKRRGRGKMRRVLNLLGEHFQDIEGQSRSGAGPGCDSLTGAPGAILGRPLIKAGLERFDRVIERGSKRHPKRLI